MMSDRLRAPAWIASLLILLCACGLWMVRATPSVTPEGTEPQPRLDARPSSLPGPAAPRMVGLVRAALEPDPVGAEIVPAKAASDPPVEYAFEMSVWHQRSDDAIEGGESTLELRLRDAVTLEPVSSQIFLWRLDAPGNALWTRGDQCQRWLTVEKAGSQIEGLAEGRYRAVVYAEASRAPWAPEFGVAGAMTRVTLDVTMPGRRGSWLVLYDEHGAKIDRAAIRDGQHTYRSARPETPPWATARTRKTAGSEEMIGAGGGGAGGSYHRRFKPVTAGPRGLPLFEVDDATRARDRSEIISVRVAGRSELTVFVEGGDAREHDYVGVAIDPASVLRSIVLPDGRTGIDVADDVEITSRAVHREDLMTSAPWREIEIEVGLRYTARSRYEPFSGTFTLAEGFVGLHPLVPRAEQDNEPGSDSGSG